MAKKKRTNDDDFLKQVQSEGDAWHEGEEMEGGFTDLDVDDGEYVCRFTGIRRGLDKNDHPYASFNFVVTDDNDSGVGQQPSIFHGLYESGNRTMQLAQGMFRGDLKRIGIDTHGKEMIQCLEEADELAKQKPLFMLDIEYDDEYDNHDIKIRPYRGDGSSKEDDNGRPDWLEEDALYGYKPSARSKPRKVFVVKGSVNEKKQTVTAMSEDEKDEWKNVAWDDLLDA